MVQKIIEINAAIFNILDLLRMHYKKICTSEIYSHDICLVYDEKRSQREFKVINTKFPRVL